MRDIVCVRVFSANACHTSVRCFAGFRQGIVAAVEVFAFLRRSVRVLREDRIVRHTLSLFCRRSFLLGSLPYMRNKRCSSGDRA